MSTRWTLLLIGALLWATTLKAMTVSELVILKGQEYVVAREQLIGSADLTEYAPKDVRETVAWKAIQIWRAQPKLHVDLLEAERAGPGIFSGRVTAPGLWLNVVSSKVTTAEEKIILYAEALLFRPFAAWDTNDREKSAYWDKLAFAGEAVISQPPM